MLERFQSATIWLWLCVGIDAKGRSCIIYVPITQGGKVVDPDDASQKPRPIISAIARRCSTCAMCTAHVHDAEIEISERPEPPPRDGPLQ